MFHRSAINNEVRAYMGDTPSYGRPDKVSRKRKQQRQ
jgi:hypothetical protein